MALVPGTRLGAYEILTLLGRGGMGEVYRAYDTKLGRDVALKLLPDAFTNDPERLARFRREAQVLASLNHPHIGAIYGLEETNGQQFLVLELVDGEGLDKRIARGAIPVDEALGIAKEIAEALEAAHEKGIIHRDLKPANVALTSDGKAKVLDFGLAKAMDPLGGALHYADNSPTHTSPAMMTGIGMILGTAAYMSPQQAKGCPADKRSDLWAFGLVLMEMLTGRPVFTGETSSHVLAAVLNSDPDWAALPPEASPAIRKLLRRCLEKDSKRRLDSAANARLEIDDALAPATQADAPTVRPSRVGATGLLAAVAAGALIAGFATWG
jgi:serine/threonine protein kinase